MQTEPTKTVATELALNDQRPVSCFTVSRVGSPR